MTIKEIVASIKAKQPEIKTVYFVGCGAKYTVLILCRLRRFTV